MYDWANSAFYTTVVGTLFSPYITRLAQSYVGENGVVLDLGPLGNVTAKSLPTLCVSISVGAQVFLLPVLGALGDYSNLKKRLMAIFCYIAVVANCLMFFVKDGYYLFGGVLFIIAQQAVNQTVVQRRGLANGYVVSLYPLGAMLGAPVFGWSIAVFIGEVSVASRPLGMAGRRGCRPRRPR